VRGQSASVGVAGVGRRGRRRSAWPASVGVAGVVVGPGAWPASVGVAVGAVGVAVGAVGVAVGVAWPASVGVAGVVVGGAFSGAFSSRITDQSVICRN